MAKLFQYRYQRLLTRPASQCLALSTILLTLPIISAAEVPASAPIGSVLEQANSLYAKRRFDDARRQFEQALEIDRGSLSAWRGLGWSYWSLGQKQQAYQVWTDLIKAFPDDLPTLSALGKASEQDRRRQDATDYYARILQLQPDNQSAHLGRARLFIAQHQFQSAEQDARQALNAAPSDNTAKALLADALMGLGRYQEAEGLLSSLSRAEPTPANLQRLGKTLTELGKYEQAADTYKTGFRAKADADSLAAWRGLGAGLRKAGQNQRAYAIWRGILKDIPSDLPTLLAVGRASEQDQLWQQGLDAYARVLEKAPVERTATLGRARIFFAQKQYQAAELELKSFLARSPSDSEAGTALAENLVAMGRGAEAVQILQPMAELDPDPKKLSRLGTILADAGRHEESADYFQKSLQLDPEDSVAVLGLAHAYWERQDYSESINLLQGYLAKHPDNEVVRTRLAEHASAADNWDLAEQEWRFLVFKHPEETKWQLKLANLLHRAGRHDDAVKIANAVIATEPDNETALGLLADDALFAGNIESAIFWTNRLTTATPTLERLSRLGKLRVQLGERLDKDGKHDAAVIQYGAATQEFRRAAALDPVKSGAPVDIIQTLRLQGQQEEAIKSGQQLQARYPVSIDVNKQLAVSYRDQDDYADARDMLTRNVPFFPNSPALEQDLAELTYHAGDKERAFDMLKETLDAAKRPAVPVLLYHGITVSDRRDTVPLQKFRDQLLALKREGYQSITMTQLLGFLQGHGVLPAKPVLITFDDARSDSFKYADPVLAETGFGATMFVPVGDVATHQPYAAVWPVIRNMFATGRWDLQCHGADAQHYVPVDAEGHMGHFLANKMWLKDADRLETDKEFAGRIESDMQTCKTTVVREVPGVHIFAFAFPYGDQGHRSLSNTPDAFNINQSTVKKQFSLAFNVDNTNLVTGRSSKFILPRFEVPRTYSGEDLVRQLKSIDPVLSTNSTLAHLDVESGRYEQALEIMDKLTNEGAMDKVELLTTSGKVLNWSGDHAGSRNYLNKAIALRPNDPLIQVEIDKLDHRLGPSVQMNGLYFEDNADRSFYSLGPSAQYGVSDGLSVSAYYKYLDFKQTLNKGNVGTVNGQQEFQAGGNQFGGRLNYELSARSLLSVSAGVADFSGSASPTPLKPDSTFPLGSIDLTAGVGDRVDLSLSADHTYVNTAGAIINGIAFSRVEGKIKAKLLDSLSLTASNAYFYYTDNNQRDRTEIQVDSPVWNNPDITVGVQFIHDDTRDNNLLFWTPDNYLAFSAPVSVKKKWGQSLVTELTLAPGMGKEADNAFKFQLGGSGIVSWNVRDDLSLNLSVNRYQAATYSNFSAFFGVNLKF